MVRRKNQQVPGTWLIACVMWGFVQAYSATERTIVQAGGICNPAGLSSGIFGFTLRSAVRYAAPKNPAGLSSGSFGFALQ